jgi:aminobenzoyl-glutamate utilization protein B
MFSEKMDSFSWIEENKNRMIQVSDKVWELAEPSSAEFKSSTLLADELEKHGFTVERGVAGLPTAFVASWGETKPVIAMMGEYDALPGLSQKKVPLKAPLEPGKPGHGCGHNIHGTSGMAAAIALKRTMKKHWLKGTVKFFGCPAEETLSGKVFMVRDGLFSGVDAAIGHHPSSMNAVSLKNCLALNSAKFHFYGKASHAGGSPDQGRSALDAVELMNVGVNFLREHVIQDARIHYIIGEGGGQPNIVPQYARSWYYVRAPERDQVEFIYNWVLDIAEGAAKMTRTELKHEFTGGVYNLIPNRTIAELIVNNMREIGTPEYTDEEWKFAREMAKSITPEMKIEQLRKSKRPEWERFTDKLIDDEVPDPWGEGELNHFSTDVGDVSWQTPTVEFNTATCILGTPWHSWQCTSQSGVGLGHKSLIFAAKVMAATAIDLLMDVDLLNKAKKEHKRRVGDRKYKCSIPPEMKPPLDIWKRSAE